MHCEQSIYVYFMRATWRQVCGFGGDFMFSHLSFVALKAYLGTIFKIDDSKGTNIIAGGARRRLRFSTTCYLRWSVVAMENQSLTGLCYLI